MTTLTLCANSDGTIYSLGLCYRCYQAKWVETTTAPIVHGRASSYTIRKCRCEACTTAQREYNRDWYRRKRAKGVTP